MAESVHVVGEVTALHKEQKVRVVIQGAGKHMVTHLSESLK